MKYPPVGAMLYVETWTHGAYTCEVLAIEPGKAYPLFVRRADNSLTNVAWPHYKVRIISPSYHLLTRV